MTSRDQDDLDAAVAAAATHPQDQVDDLPVDVASRELMEKIMSTEPRSTRSTLSESGPATRRTRRLVIPLLAAAAVTAIVTGSLALQTAGGDSPSEEAAPASTGTPSSTGAPTTSDKPTKTAPATPKGPSLPPTADNLHDVVLEADGWKVEDLDDSEFGGSLWWSNGALDAYMNWYPKEDYAMYLADRREIGPAEKIELLGQEGLAFTYQDMGDPVMDKDDPTVKGAPVETDSTADEDSGPNPARKMVILPPVGDWYIVFDVSAEDAESVDALLMSLRRVPRDEWLAAMEDTTVQPADAEEFLDQVSQGVPMPAGATVEPDDLNLPQSAYHARLAFIGPVVCGWAEDYVAGDTEALKVLRGSKDWPGVKALSPEGEYGSVLADAVESLATDHNMGDFRQEVGC